MLVLPRPARAASIEEIDVIVFGSPKSITIKEGACRISGGPELEVATIEAMKKVVRACGPKVGQQRECQTAKAYVLECKDPALVGAPGQPPRALGRRLSIELAGRRLRVIAAIETEQYVASVVAAELGAAPLEARRVQAILARTYAARALFEPRHGKIPLCDRQHCQVFKGIAHPRAAPKIEDAPATTTLSEILIDGEGHPTPVFFHAACGGHTVDANRVWPGANAPDLIGVEDRDPNGEAWCRKHPGFSWRATVANAKLAEALHPLVERRLDPGSLRLEAEDRDGIVWRIGDRAGIRRVPGARLQPALGRAFGYSEIGSSRFSFKRGRSESILTGNGFGHGVGLCQAGAAARASAGQEAHDILKAYFPNLRLKTGPLR